MIRNFLSVDLESFLNRQFAENLKKEDDLNHTVKTTEIILDLLDTYHTKITFFLVGEIYEWYPQLIAKIEKKGHEIGYHSHRHLKLKDEHILKEDLIYSKEFLKKYSPQSFRAPRMYLKKEFIPILKEYGFKRDSSLYGTAPFTTNEGLLEIPVSFIGLSHQTFPSDLKHVFWRGIPVGSGLSVSLFGKHMQQFIGFLNKKGKPANIFIHPWQIAEYDTKNLSLSFLQRLLYKAPILKTLEYLVAKNKFFPLSHA